ncbi:MAG: hypothetical protein II412_07520 [Clostridia bacterium]|nr:hypothetical protein [Clostridia bacterium]
MFVPRTQMPNGDAVLFPADICRTSPCHPEKPRSGDEGSFRGDYCPTGGFGRSCSMSRII